MLCSPIKGIMFWRWDGVTAAAQNSAEGDNALNVPTGSDVFQVPAHSLLPTPPPPPRTFTPNVGLSLLGTPNMQASQDKAWRAYIQQASIL